MGRSYFCLFIINLTIARLFIKQLFDLSINYIIKNNKYKKKVGYIFIRSYRKKISKIFKIILV